ncbi:hypothetical protein E2C01_000563 [Portunus trituberculatus]|uniref:Uncharacterized protein n=1 Tax=Portunus trituberculatus TaxID=210409 RepID=A0A5B7CFF4_PORTR|nr:hypothetical protein [Portunus trituberculatus]
MISERAPESSSLGMVRSLSCSAVRLRVARLQKKSTATHHLILAEAADVLKDVIKRADGHGAGQITAPGQERSWNVRGYHLSRYLNTFEKNYFRSGLDQGVVCSGRGEMMGSESAYKSAFLHLTLC